MSSINLLKDYEKLADQYTIESARKKFVDGVLTGKHLVQDHPAANQSNGSHDVALARDRFQKSLAELSDLMHRAEDLEKENANTSANVGLSDDDAVIEEEIARANALLEKLNTEKLQLDTAILEKKKQIESVRASGPDLSRLNSLTIPNQTASTAAADPRIASAKSSLQELQAVYAGLCDLVGVKSMEVTESAIEGGVDMFLEIGRCTFRLTLNASKKLCDMEVVIGDVQKNDIAKILQKASAMESPQDLRYSVFALGSVQQSSEVMQQHLAPIRRACIVSMLGPRTFRMELRGGFVADVAVHECYPDVPAGVKVTRLTSASSCGVGDDAKALEDNLERVRSETNVRCFSILSDMFDFLVGPKGLASLQP